MTNFGLAAATNYMRIGERMAKHWSCDQSCDQTLWLPVEVGSFPVGLLDQQLQGTGTYECSILWR